MLTLNLGIPCYMIQCKYVNLKVISVNRLFLLQISHYLCKSKVLLNSFRCVKYLKISGQNDNKTIQGLRDTRVINLIYRYEHLCQGNPKVMTTKKIFSISGFFSLVLKHIRVPKFLDKIKQRNGSNRYKIAPMDLLQCP